MKDHALFAYRPVVLAALCLSALTGCTSSPEISSAPPVVDGPAKRRSDAAERAQIEKKMARTQARIDADMAAKRRRDDAEARRDQLTNGEVDPGLPRRALNAMTADREQKEAQQQAGAVAEQRP